MKTRIILFAVVAIALLSFTFVKGNTEDTKSIRNNQSSASASDTQGGIILEDKAEW